MHVVRVIAGRIRVVRRPEEGLGRLLRARRELGQIRGEPLGVRDRYPAHQHLGHAGAVHVAVAEIGGEQPHVGCHHPGRHHAVAEPEQIPVVEAPLTDQRHVAQPAVALVVEPLDVALQRVRARDAEVDLIVDGLQGHGRGREPLRLAQRDQALGRFQQVPRGQ